MAITNSTKRDGLYKQPGSDCWYMSFSLDGKRIRKSTACTSYEAAKQVLQRRLQAKAEAKRNQEWEVYVEEMHRLPKSWLAKMLASAKSRSSRLNRKCDLTLDELKLIAIRSGGRCEVTGITFRRPTGHHEPLAPSLDRADISKGYTFDNCRLVCMAVNFAMNRWGEDVMLLIAKAMLHKHLSEELGYAVVRNGGAELPANSPR